MKAEKQRRLSAKVARLMLAREMWMRDNQAYDSSAWDDDTLLTTTYERYIERADRTIRDAMELERA